jgi:hypothetical protein
MSFYILFFQKGRVNALFWNKGIFQSCFYEKLKKAIHLGSGKGLLLFQEPYLLFGEQLLPALSRLLRLEEKGFQER